MSEVVMKKNYGSFHSFVCSDKGFNKLHALLTRVVTEKLGAHAATIDPNWASVHMDFTRRHELEHLDGRTPSFDVKPKRVWLNGPKFGDVSLDNVFEEILPEPLVALVRVMEFYDGWEIYAKNSKHHIELLDRRLEISFEHCDTGYVRNVSGESFEVVSFNFGDVEAYDRGRLEWELKQPHRTGSCHAVSFTYYPRMATDENDAPTRFESVDDSLAQAERYKAKMAAQRAEVKSDECAALDETPPETDDRLSAQAKIAHALFPLLPRPFT